METAGLFIFPWDFADKGVDATIDNVASLGINWLCLTGTHHAGFFTAAQPDEKVELGRRRCGLLPRRPFALDDVGVTRRPGDSSSG